MRETGDYLGVRELIAGVSAVGTLAIGTAPRREAGPMDQAPTVGDRVRDVRKRRGLTQRALAEASGVSLSLVKKLEQGDYGDARLETLHRLASTLRVPTSSLTAGPDAESPEREDVEQWAPVRQALEGTNPDHSR
jgi:DNA-binding XRE family transcriptional regulator